MQKKKNQKKWGGTSNMSADVMPESIN